MKNNDWLVKHRSRTLKDVVGQKVTLKSLAKHLRDRTLPQNILFSGPTGTGKTTIARLIAKSLNCESPNIDIYDGIEYFVACEECSSCNIIELDEDGNNFHFYDGSSVNKEEIEKIKKLCNTPVWTGNKSKSRIVYIEEIQNISSGKDSSMQALLKLIEKDYRGSVHFIFSTMALKKINKAVIDRFGSNHYKLKPVKSEELISLAQSILETEDLLKDVIFDQIPFATDGISLFLKEGLNLIAQSANGSAREFVGMLEACIQRELYSIDTITEELDILTLDMVIDLMKSLLEKNWSFFEAVRKQESKLSDFYNISFSNIVDLISYQKSGIARFDFQKINFDKLLKVSNIDLEGLLKAYLKVQQGTQAYFKDSFYYGEIINYYLGDNKPEVVYSASASNNKDSEKGGVRVRER